MRTWGIEPDRLRGAARERRDLFGRLVSVKVYAEQLRRAQEQFDEAVHRARLAGIAEITIAEAARGRMFPALDRLQPRVRPMGRLP